MSAGTRILISESNIPIQESFKSYCTSSNFELKFCEKDGKIILREIREFCPDIVICDVFLRGMDAIEMRKQALQTSQPPALFFIASGFDNENIINSLINSGFDYYFLKPYDVESVLERIKLFQFQGRLIFNTQLELIITDVLQKFEIPPHIRGYLYHRQAIALAVRNPDIMNNITRQLYPQIAVMNNTTAARAERAMRTAIDIAWDRADINILNNYFGFHVNNGTKPSNSEFIAKISDSIRLHHNRKTV